MELITTGLTGKEAPDILADFEFNEEGAKVLRRPAGHEPGAVLFRNRAVSVPFRFYMSSVPAVLIRINAGPRDSDC